MNDRLETEFTLDPSQDDGIDDLNDDKLWWEWWF